MRIVTIGSTDLDRQGFDIWMMALLADKRDHNRAALKKLLSVQELLEGVTHELAEADTERGYQKGALVLTAQPCTLVFEEEQFDELKRAMDAVGWRAVAAKQVTHAYDMLDAAEHVNAAELAKRTASEPTA